MNPEAPERLMQEERTRGLKLKAADEGGDLEPLVALKRRADALEHDHRMIVRDQVETEAALKVDINNLLWKHVPSSMTMGQAEELACKIYTLMVSP